MDDLNIFFYLFKTIFFYSAYLGISNKNQNIIQNSSISYVIFIKFNCLNINQFLFFQLNFLNANFFNAIKSKLNIINKSFKLLIINKNIIFDPKIHLFFFLSLVLFIPESHLLNKDNKS